MKALVAEAVGILSNRLKQYGVVVRELTGDQSLTRHQIEETHIIVTTPELRSGMLLPENQVIGLIHSL